MEHYFAEMNSQEDYKTPFRKLDAKLKQERVIRKKIATEIIKELEQSLRWIDCDDTSHLDRQVYAIPEEVIEELKEKYGVKP